MNLEPIVTILKSNGDIVMLIFATVIAAKKYASSRGGRQDGKKEHYD